MARALLTGGTGFIGANLARRLLRDNYEVHLLLRPGHDSWRIADIQHHLTVHICDLADLQAVQNVIEKSQPNHLFHLAASGAYSWQTDASQMIQANIVATANLLAATKNSSVRSFIHTGSSSEYGYKNHPASESEVLEPNSEYAATKAAATHLCSLARQRDQRHVTTLRLYSIYGPWEDPRRLIPTLIAAGFKGRLPPLVSPYIARDFVYIDDVLDAILLVVQSAAAISPVYNLGSGIQTTLEQVVATARKLLSISETPTWSTMPPRPWDTSCWISDPALIRKELGWRAVTTFEEGLARTIEWTRQNPSHH